MIYGDNPQKTNEREDALGTALYSYWPQVTAIMQSGNLYVYAINNPILYFDRSGEESEHIVQVWECAKQLPYCDGPYPFGDILALGLVVFVLQKHKKRNKCCAD